MKFSYKYLALFILVAVIAAGAGYWLGYDHGFERAVQAGISSFEECAAAGNPVGESYPRQCWTEDGKHFVEELDEPVLCTQDAKQCPDGSFVGRIPPDCRFVSCPGE